MRKLLMFFIVNALSMAAGAQKDSRPTLVVPQAHLPGSGGVRVLAVNPASSWFATLGNDETLCVWNSADGQFLAKAPAKDLRSVAVLPKSHLAVLGDAHGGVRLVDVDTFTTVNTTTLGSSVEWLQSTEDGRVFAATYRGLYRLDAATLAASQLSDFAGLTPYRVAMNEVGSAIAIDFTRLGTADHVAVYSTADGAKKLERDLPRVGPIAISGNVVAIGSTDSDDIHMRTGHVLVLRVADGSVSANVAVKNASVSLLLLQQEKQVSEIISAFPGGTERINLASGKSLQQVEKSEVYSQLAMPGGQLIAASASGVPILCDAVTLQCKFPMVVQGVRVTQARTLEDGRLLLMDTSGNAIKIKDSVESDKLYNGPTLALVPTFKGTPGIFAIARSDDTALAVQVNNGLAPVAPPDLLAIASTVTLAASENGHYLAARKASISGRHLTVTLYDLSRMTNGPLAQAPEWTKWDLDAENQYVTDASGEFQFAFTPDARLLVAVDGFTGSIRRYDLAKKRELWPVLHGQDGAAVDPNGPRYVSAWTLSGDGQKVVLGWFDSVNTVSLDTGAATTRVKLKAAIEGLVGGDGGSSFIALANGTLLAWDGQEQPTVLATQEFSSDSLLYVKDRHLLIVNAADGSIRMLDTRSGEERMDLALFANGKDWLLWTPAGLFDASDQGWRGVQWKFEKNTFAASEPVEDFIDDYEVPGLAGLVLAGMAPKPPVLRVRERRTPTVRVMTSGVSAGKVNLSVAVSAAEGVEIQNVHLSRNGVLLKTWPEKLVSGTHLALTADVVAGDNSFAAYAFNQDDVKSVDGTAGVTGPESLRRPGDLYVVAIGVNEYRNRAFALNYARQDALLAAGVLSTQRKEVQSLGRQVLAQEEAEGKPNGVSYDQVDLRYSLGDAHVTTLVDSQATRETILKMIADVSHRARAEDTIVIYYAGHGVAVDDRYYLLPQDFAFEGQPAGVRASGLDALKKSAISDLDLQQALEGEQAAVSALILDACQSGELLGDTSRRRGPMNSRGLAQMAYDKRMYILAASLSTQNAKEQAELEHGVLTYALMEEGLAQDLASPVRTPMGGGMTTLPQWLRWGAQRVAQGGVGGSAARGVIAELDKNKPKAAQVIQQPRLFAPPDEGIQVAVALRAIPIDPKTMTASGYTQEAPPAPVHSTPDNLLFPASTLGYMRPSTLSATGAQALAAEGGRIVTVDLDHGGVLSRRPVGGTLLSFDIAANREVVAMDQTGNVMLVPEGDSAAKIVVQGFGWNVNGMVRWLGSAGQILAVTDQTVAVYTHEGTKVTGVTLAATGVHGPVVSAKGDWLYLADWSGKVHSFQLPSLDAGPVWARTVQPTPPGATVKYVSSLVVDPAGRHLLRIMNDGSFEQAQLPSLTAEVSPFTGLPGIYAATYSPDGKTLYAGDTKGLLQSLDGTSGAVKASWPSLLDHADALAIDHEGRVLVASGNGGLSAWNLPDGRVRSSVAGGGYYAAASFAGSTTLDVMLSNRSRLRTFALPGSGSTSDVVAPDEFFVSRNRMIGNSLHGKTIWDRSDARRTMQVPIAGDGRAVLTPDGSYLAWAVNQSPTGLIEVFNTVTGKKVQEVKLASSVGAFTLSNDGRTVFSSIGDQLYIGNGPPLTVPQLPCCVMALSSLGDILLTASNLGDVMLYDLGAKKILRRQQTGYTVAAAEFSPLTDQVVLVSDSGTVLLWNPDSSEGPRLVGGVKGNPVGIAFNATGSEAVVSTDGGEIGWFSLTNGGSELATSTWLEATQSWLTVAADRRFSIAGDVKTRLGLKGAKDTEWKPALQLPGFTPSLLEELLAK
jgi:WD40 repeat protein